MARLRPEHHRHIGDGYCVRPAELDSSFIRSATPAPPSPSASSSGPPLQPRHETFHQQPDRPRPAVHPPARPRAGLMTHRPGLAHRPPLRDEELSTSSARRRGRGRTRLTATSRGAHRARRGPATAEHDHLTWITEPCRSGKPSARHHGGFSQWRKRYIPERVVSLPGPWSQPRESSGPTWSAEGSGA
jgi:hypothetical protein